MEKKNNETYPEGSRRKFLKNSMLLGGLAGATITGGSGLVHAAGMHTGDGKDKDDAGGEVLYNGIVLPNEWPPRNMRADSYAPMPVPYLADPPALIPVDTGRQLFVDDFLIEYTDLERKFHQPVKHVDNPVLKPETKIEMNEGYCPMAAPFSDGCFYDPQDNLFKAWYMAGWFDGTALATSKDGIHWERPKLDVVPGTNLVLAPKDNLKRDGVSVWIDHEAKNAKERFKMYLYARKGDIGKELSHAGGFLLTSADGIHWNWKDGKIARTSDNNTFFYNPFRKKWVFTIRRETRPVQPWSDPVKITNGRARSYWEAPDFYAAMNGWEGAVFWFGADKNDPKRVNYDIGEEPQIYKLDAVGYESLMIGLVQPHYGPANEICAKGGYPKLTELQLAFSRDGFHWDRSNRQSFIQGEPHNKESWERAYIHSIGGVCNIVDDKLFFYYTAFRGDENNRNPIGHWNGMYANASMGLATLRRDGFASMETDTEGILMTRPLKFTGKHLFVNAISTQGRLYVEICDKDGRPMPGFGKQDCQAISTDSTRQPVTWKGNDLQQLAGKPVRIKFYLTNSRLYSFWISRNLQGVSGGAVAAGGPGLKGYWDI
jgi:hypothetical protein